MCNQHVCVQKRAKDWCTHFYKIDISYCMRLVYSLCCQMKPIKKIWLLKKDPMSVFILDVGYMF